MASVPAEQAVITVSAGPASPYPRAGAGAGPPAACRRAGDRHWPSGTEAHSAGAALLSTPAGLRWRRTRHRGGPT
ncbi:MAG: hypothetical protein ACOC98_12905 [Thermodesulfobacteriota bacterium]